MSRQRTLAAAALLTVVSLTALGLSAVPVPSQDHAPRTDDDDEAEMFMRSKLSMAHKIIDGLATDDFTLVESGAVELANLADAAAWKRPEDRYYSYYSGSFEQAARRLIDAAQSESPEQSVYAWVGVQFSCTACHQHVRRVHRVAVGR